MTHITCRLTAKYRDQLRNGTLRSVIEYGLPYLFTPDTTRRSCLCRGWVSSFLTAHQHIIGHFSAISVSCLMCLCALDDCSERDQTTHFLSATVLSCEKSNSHRRSGRDTEKTVSFVVSDVAVWINFKKSNAQTALNRRSDSASFLCCPW